MNRRNFLKSAGIAGGVFGDVEFFMQRYFDHTIDVITNPEPLDILAVSYTHLDVYKRQTYFYVFLALNK